MEEATLSNTGRRRSIPSSATAAVRTLRASLLAAVFALATVLGLGAQATLAQDTASASALAVVNINTADADALASALKGVGFARAQEIVRYREAYGPFGSVEELMEVNGIGPSTLEANRQAITLE